MEIKQLRFSCIWTVSLLKIKEFEVGEGVYRQVFKDTLERQSGVWSPPWNTIKDSTWEDSLNQSFFWKKYLELDNPKIRSKKDYASILFEERSRSKIWSHLLPLKYNIPKLTIETKSQHIKFESFRYPYGIGIVATLYIKIKPKTSLEDTINYAINSRYDEVYKINYENDQSDTGNLQLLAEKLFDRLSLQLLPKQSIDTTGHNICLPKDPFIIATIINAKSTESEEFSDLSKSYPNCWDNLVAGLCDWNKQWKDNNSIGKIIPNLKHDPSKNFVNSIIGTERSRLIFFPKYFTENLGKPTKTPKHYPLGNYHRHLLFLSLQTEMLMGILEDYIDIPQPSTHQKYIAKRALVLIKLILRSSKTKKSGVFQSWSAFKRIELSYKIIEDANFKLRAKKFDIAKIIVPSPPV
ncbi:MAG: hypothetical protein NTY50_07885 [Methylobacter sp.]|nr:hypothetical protein [Methylobacter sp.]